MELSVWEKAHQLVLKIYKLTKKLPVEEKFGLTFQMRRCSVSISSNLAEGFKRKGYKDALNFFNRSAASLEELKYQTLLCFDLSYFNLTDYQSLKELEWEVDRLLVSWQKNYRPRLNTNSTLSTLST